MKALIQRVSYASVSVDGNIVGKIEAGILLFLGIEKDDTSIEADKLLKRVLGYRIFPDQNDRMNLNIAQVLGGLLVVSQFTLVADTGKGLRPGFSSAAPAEQGEHLYNYFVNKAKADHPVVATGQYGADMKVELLNNGPVTFMLEV
ncbi:MAG: D-aminoacyl-tRNA deacylase [Pseudomonadales bacterium]|jgi:D-tyrosyl-tRNA(Tyr) deacylase|nr:D-aminoacyl-tRNA deacylase [Pseudomonadales bacterium]